MSRQILTATNDVVSTIGDGHVIICDTPSPCTPRPAVSFIGPTFAGTFGDPLIVIGDASKIGLTEAGAHRECHGQDFPIIISPENALLAEAASAIGEVRFFNVSSGTQVASIPVGSDGGVLAWMADMATCGTTRSTEP